MTDALPPTVLYHCPCTGAMRHSDASNEPAEKRSKYSVDTMQSSQSQRPPVDSHSALFPLRVSTLENLYYCDDCSSLRCTRCVVEEPAGYHCPNCLFEVNTTSVRSEKNSCARNCFQCPVCTHVLSVVESSEGERPFSLSCTLCCWNSREIGWEFEKATGISAQIERLRAAEDAPREYSALLDYWRTVQRVSAASTAAAGAGSFKQRLAVSNTSVVPEYRTVAGSSDTEQVRVAELMALENADYVPYTSDPRRNEPQRIRLHMKLARRCCSCHHILIKPMPKAQATQFKIQLMAANFLPTITLPSRLSLKYPPQSLEGPFAVGRALPVILRFANPLYTEMKVGVSTCSPGDVRVEVISKQFTLPPYTEPWEYDDDEDDDSSSDLHNSSSDQRAGIVDRHGNRVAIQLSVTPLVPAPNLVVPLYITCSHIDDIDGEKDRSSSAVSKSSSRAVTDSFWIYVILGSAQ
ncbi:hypothetical protein IW146_009095 [Coemansia sp. RSA 922]|nr:hypothetical protein GGI08_004496 [Coemansia sp. S2]KAJ2102443.1 hypothetical protein IW146_009095 [Coemansia sp. RSA 922]